MCFGRGFLSLLAVMGDNLKDIKSKRLKFIRILMYLDALLILLSFMMLDIPRFSFAACSGVCLRIVILAGIFIVLLVLEKSLSRYLRKHRNEL